MIEPTGRGSGSGSGRAEQRRAEGENMYLCLAVASIERLSSRKRAIQPESRTTDMHFKWLSRSAVGVCKWSERRWWSLKEGGRAEVVLRRGSDAGILGLRRLAVGIVF
jgi:hypothetical protein